jgi:hypothetical protein
MVQKEKLEFLQFVHYEELLDICQYINRKQKLFRCFIRQKMIELSVTGIREIHGKKT